MNGQFRRFIVAIAATLELPFAIAGGLNLLTNFSLAVVLIAVASALNFVYVYEKPYWNSE
jgi:hypothetical protein